jgi:hypothetical protein
MSGIGAHPTSRMLREPTGSSRSRWSTGGVEWWCGTASVLGHGEPRLWIMHLPHVGLGFSRIARHRRVTQCLGSLGGKEWLIGVAPPGDLGDEARPELEDIVAFRVPGDRLIKLQVATWHAGPHFVHDECRFVNLENLDTNRRDFHGVPLPAECRYRL